MVVRARTVLIWTSWVTYSSQFASRPRLKCQTRSSGGGRRGHIPPSHSPIFPGGLAFIAEWVLAPRRRWCRPGLFVIEGIHSHPAKYHRWGITPKFLVLRLHGEWDNGPANRGKARSIEYTQSTAIWAALAVREPECGYRRNKGKKKMKKKQETSICT